MNIRDEILKEHSKKQSKKIADFIGNDKKKFAELMKLFLGNTYRITQRAAWVVVSCAHKHPSLVFPWLNKMISLLEKDVHQAVKRNTLRLFEVIEVPKSQQGRVADICFRFLLSSNESIAVKVYAMTTLQKICTHEPELKNELRIVLLDQMENAGPAFRSRANRVLSMLNEND